MSYTHNTMSNTTVPADNQHALSLVSEIKARIASCSSAVVALSGGVDSSVVAALATAALGPRALAVTGLSQSLAQGELLEIEGFCHKLGLAHLCVPTHELQNPNYVTNTPERCYYCKRELFHTLSQIARQKGYDKVLDGCTADDLHAHRPGRRAAMELGVISPLCDVGATKTDVRAIAFHLGLDNAARPASPCLSSRIAYGVAVTAERLARVEQAEAFLRGLGFSDLRVRLHDAIARIEVPKAELSHAVAEAETISNRLRTLGFTYVTLDLMGLRSGSLLEILDNSAP